MKKGEVSTKVVEKSREAENGKKEGENKGKPFSNTEREVRKEPRCDNYTPLVSSLDRVLMEIWEHHALKWPSTSAPQPKSSPTYGNGKLCKFHNEYGNGTEECSHLKDEIARLVRENRLNNYVARPR